jgi:hypothetical protein
MMDRESVATFGTVIGVVSMVVVGMMAYYMKASPLWIAFPAFMGGCGVGVFVFRARKQ